MSNGFIKFRFYVCYVLIHVHSIPGGGVALSLSLMLLFVPCIVSSLYAYAMSEARADDNGGSCSILLSEYVFT